jgi:assimilatory nitrate reductase catalytic subunit
MTIEVPIPLPTSPLKGEEHPRFDSGAAAPKETRSTCPYCGVGCGVIIESHGDQITGVRGDPDHPANFGRLCTKGSTLHLTATPAVIQHARIHHPLMRRTRDEPRARVTWDNALDHVADRFAAIIEEHGSDAVAFYISGQLLTEDYYVFNKLAKGLIGTNNVDTNSRLCMSSAVAGYKQTLGADAPPACYEDFDHADLLLIAGSNTAYAHPILYRRIEDARKRASDSGTPMRIIVIDPRRTDTAREADLHLAIAPGTDVALFNGLLHLCLWDDRVASDFIEAHTEGWAELKRLVRDYTPRFVANTCGISEEDLSTAARWFGEARAALSIYCQGLNQSASGTAKNAALINLHLATAQIGRPGAGPFSLTGQPNAMGGREVGGMANLLSGHRDLNNATHRAEVAALWGIADVPATRGKTAVELFEAIAAGTIKAVWIACTNPLQSMPEQALVHAALAKAELVVLQESFASSATAAYADVLLPAATWGEKSGSVTNSERRISLVRQAVAAPGEARDDWAIVCDFARRLASRIAPERATMLDYANAESIWNEHRDTTRGRDLDITGLSYAILDASGPQLWPFPTGASEGKKRLYEDGIFPTPSGRARFVVTPYKPLAEPVDARYPFALNTGRLRDQWHGMSRSGTVPQLFGHSAEPSIDLAEIDVKRRLLNEGDFVQVTSKRGSQVLRVRVSDAMRAGHAFIAMHWGEEYLGGHGDRHGVNTLTNPRFDRDSMQPELKHAAVRIVKLELPHRLVAFGWMDADRVADAMTRLRSCFASFDYASCVPFGRAADGNAATTRIGVLFRGAHSDAIDVATVEAIEQEIGIAAIDAPTEATSHLLRYDDARRGHARRVLVRDGVLASVSLRGDWSAEGWLKEYLEEAMPVAQLGRLLLKPGTTAPSGFKSRGRVVCNCWNVSENEIVATLEPLGGSAAERLLALQVRLKCGTQCGSCLPELKRMIAESRGTVSA